MMLQVEANEPSTFLSKNKKTCIVLRCVYPIHPRFDFFLVSTSGEVLQPCAYASVASGLSLFHVHRSRMLFTALNLQGP